MTHYCVYFTIYLGERLPPFYIGSTTIEKIKNGYHGTVCSVQYKDIWKSELKNNPRLFYTIVIPDQYATSLTDILELELKWQKLFTVVSSPLFINMSYARKGFCGNMESGRKAATSRIKNGTNVRSAATKQAMSISKQNQSIETRTKNSEKHKGKNHSTETKIKISVAKTNPSIETRLKMSTSQLGHTVTEETRRKQREANLGHEVGLTTRLKLKESQLGMKLWNNGQIQVRSKLSPGKEWVLGKIKRGG